MNWRHWMAPGISPLVQEIYANASSFIKKPVTLNKLVSEIDKLDWYSARQEGLGDLYEGLLQKNAEEKKSGAGTGGFLIAAQHWIRELRMAAREVEAAHGPAFFGFKKADAVSHASVDSGFPVLCPLKPPAQAAGIGTFSRCRGFAHPNSGVRVFRVVGRANAPTSPGRGGPRKAIALRYCCFRGGRRSKRIRKKLLSRASVANTLACSTSAAFNSAMIVNRPAQGANGMR